MQVDPITSLKTCSACHAPKPLTDFYRSAAQRDGYDHRCKDCQRLRMRQWRENHPEHDRLYRADNRDRLEAGAQAWRAANLEKVRATRRAATKRWRKAHPEARRERARVDNHRRRRGASEGAFTPAEWEALCRRYGNRCLACGRTDLPLTIDHIVPLSKGGSNWITNAQPLCQPCNTRKHDRVIDYRPTA